MAKSPTARKGAEVPPPQAPQLRSGSKPARNGNRPVHTIRYRGCEAAIWKNTSADKDFYSVTVRKSWRDDKGDWHDAQTFLAADLPMLAKAISDAHTWIAWQERQARAKGGGR